MTGTDIRIKTSWRDHPKRLRLEGRLGAEGVVALTDLWLWAGERRPDGDLSSLNDAEIEIAARWRGARGTFVPLLRELGFLEADGTLHDWTDHNPYTAASEARSRHMKKVNHDRAVEKRGGECGVAKCGFCNPPTLAAPITETVTGTVNDSITGTITATVECGSGSGSGSGSGDSQCNERVDDPEAVRLAGLLLLLHTERDPKFGPAKRPATVKTWARDIGKLLRANGRTPAEIEAVIRYVVADRFECANVQSGKKLRERFDSLIAKLPAGTWQHGRQHGRFQPPDASEVLAEREAARRAIEAQRTTSTAEVRS